MIAADPNALLTALAALALMGVALALAIATLTARALFVACATTILLAAAAATVLLMQDAVLPAVALAIFGAALLPTWLLGGMLLSGSAVKVTRRGGTVLGVAAAGATAALIVTVVPDMSATRALSAASPPGLGALLAALLFTAALGVVGMLGYGERGALEPKKGAP